jgi:hypothetical protein
VVGQRTCQGRAVPAWKRHRERADEDRHQEPDRHLRQAARVGQGDPGEPARPVDAGARASHPPWERPTRCTDAGTGPRLEAVILLAMSAGLGSGVLPGQRDAQDALATIRHQLDRLR